MAGSIPTLVRSLKSAVTQKVNQLNCTLGGKLWQRNYWQRLIRDESELNAYREYMQNNPAQWEMDQFYQAIESDL